MSVTQRLLLFIVSIPDSTFGSQPLTMQPRNAYSRERKPNYARP
jgi:hypothetical protein